MLQGDPLRNGQLSPRQAALQRQLARKAADLRLDYLPKLTTGEVKPPPGWGIDGETRAGGHDNDAAASSKDRSEQSLKGNAERTSERSKVSLESDADQESTENDRSEDSGLWYTNSE